MKKIVLFLIVSLFAFSAHAAEVKIAYVNLKKTLHESDRGKEALKILENIVNIKQSLIDEKRDEIKKLDEEIAKQASILTRESLERKQQQRGTLIRDFQRIVKDSEEEVQKKEVEFFQKILLDLRKLINEIGETGEYTAIFETVEGGILYMPKKLDLTDEVIKKFNETTKAAKKENKTE